MQILEYYTTELIEYADAQMMVHKPEADLVPNKIGSLYPTM